ncbi:phage terminase large subunit [Roseiconus lacunae]|uniref:phage terminase large subunit n=1 Tax=Roseiconus lacunae TaxID=2605694 RepID=UPI001E5B4465|nr:phage terminase large subunit [Roseiconus lacunae]MCD0459126.1 phage terminase large subunit [Roseiconus lacunae]
MVALSLRPFPIYSKQAEFLQTDAWLTGFCGGRGTGKTYIGSYDIQMTAKRDEPWMCVSPDAGVVTETTLPTFIEVADTCGTLVRVVKSPYPRVYWRTRDRGIASIVFRSGEVPGKLRGPSKAGLWIDEASVVSREAFDIAIATLRYKGRMGPCKLTFTPRGRLHWTFEEFYEPVPDAPVIGNDGCTSDGLIYIQGRAYRAKADSHLVRAHTLDNPFLPDRFYELLRARYSTVLAEQELAGEFVDIAGLMFRREWFLSVDSAPRDARRVRYWDRASTPGSGKYSAGVLLAMDSRGLIYIEDVVRGQWSYHDRNRIMEQTAERDRRKYGGEVVVYTEQEGGSAGKEVSQQIVSLLAGHPIFVDIVGGKQSRKVDGQELPGDAKVIRAMPFEAQAEAGNVRIVRGPWNADYLDELTAFPEYTYSDQVDATSGAFNKLAKGRVYDGDTAATKQTVQPSSERFGVNFALERIRHRRANR